MPAASSMYLRRSSGLGEQDLLELALTHDGVEGAADARSRDRSSWTSSSRTTWPLIRYSLSPLRKIVRLTSISDIGHRDLARAVVDDELDLGHAERGPRGRAGEDDVGHVAAAQGPRALLAQDPADRVDQVRLAGAVRTDDDATRPG